MSDGRSPNDSGEHSSWIDKITRLFTSTPKTREDINQFFVLAKEHQLLDEDEFTIMQGALEVTDIQVREVMVPRSRMIMIKATDTPAEFLPDVIKSAHSRFPVMGEDNDDVLGILHAKDLLPLILEAGHNDFDISTYIRPVHKVPESRRLNKLLHDFRTTRNHMAIVIDEYGGVSGLITIEDVLEEIVGEIEDEFDVEEDESIKRLSDNDFLVKGHTTIEDFNKLFNADMDDSEYDTIAGLVTHQFGYIPQRNEAVDIGSFNFRILHADKRRVHLLRVQLKD